VACALFCETVCGPKEFNEAVVAFLDKNTLLKKQK